MKKIRMDLFAFTTLTLVACGVMFGFYRIDNEPQKTTSVPEPYLDGVMYRGYNIERTYVHGRTFYVLVNSSGQPIQMIISN